MKVAFITNLRAPYRTLQLNEFAKIEDVDLTVYYTNKPVDNRSWKTNKASGFKEVDLDGFRITKTYGYINKGIKNIITESDVIIFGGYQEPSILYASLICRLKNKPYIIFFDGISTNRLTIKENKIKKLLKQIVINKSEKIMANGIIGKRYLNEQFGYPVEKIYNQYLTVDGNYISELGNKRDEYREEYRKKLNISETEKVIIYSGRLINIKNVESVIKSLAKIKEERIVFVILGGGPLEEDLYNLSNMYGIKTIITGFIRNQDELFKHYFLGDIFILPSYEEPWGLVANEAMFAGLPVLISDVCGCSLDLVLDGENGYVFNPINIDEISEYIRVTFNEKDLKSMGEKSKEIINSWTFENSKKNLETILDNYR